MRPPHDRYADIQAVLQATGVGTVCREARCPNRSECWSAGTATIMVLGTDCTRRCGFCAVTTRSHHGRVDLTEPDRVAEAIGRWRLNYVVITQVCRDDLPDGGASILAATVRQVRQRSPTTRVELLIGDLAGDPEALRTVVRAGPDVLAHNVETVERISPLVRDRRASYSRSLDVLAEAKRAGASELVTKSSLMLGLGERAEELDVAFSDLRRAGVDLLTLGQYLRPSPQHVPVDRYVPPEEFDRLAVRARAAGFAGVAAGPLVRSSYRADELFRLARAAE